MRKPWLPRPWFACEKPFGRRWYLARAICRILGHSWEPYEASSSWFTCGRCCRTTTKQDLVERGEKLP